MSIARGGEEVDVHDASNRDDLSPWFDALSSPWDIRCHRCGEPIQASTTQMLKKARLREINPNATFYCWPVCRGDKTKRGYYLGRR